jgi:hypothetical protein
VIWLKLEMSNNDPKVIGKLFRDAVIEVGGCPSILRTYRGTENGIMFSGQCFLRRNGTDLFAGLKAHRFGSSHSNQRIEAWWLYLRQSRTSWWINFFKDLIDAGSLDASKCIWSAFSFVSIRSYRKN